MRTHAVISISLFSIRRAVSLSKKIRYGFSVLEIVGGRRRRLKLAPNLPIENSSACTALIDAWDPKVTA